MSQDPQTILNETDMQTIRIVEDVIDLLVSKELISLVELPLEVQMRLSLRKSKREELSGSPQQ